MRTPVAIFTYNRPSQLRQLFESLLQCARLDECHFHIFCDGAKRPEHSASVRASRQVVNEFAQKINALVVKRDQNMGLAGSIVAGVTDLCAQYERVIVLEDDFILHPGFLDFMLQSLDRYADDERVVQVAGFTFPIQTPAKPDAFFLPLTTSWGWATWARAWKYFSWDTQFALSILETDTELRVRFNLNSAYPYYEMLKRVAEGEVDSWAILWYFFTFNADKLTLYPRQSLVWQNGFDESATNTRGKFVGLHTSLNTFLTTKWKAELSFPSQVEPNQVLFDRLIKFLKTHNTQPATRQFIAYMRAKSKSLFEKIGL